MTRATDHEVVSIYRHSDDQIHELMTRAPECVLMGGTKDGWPVGVLHSFDWQDSHVWITFAAHRHRAGELSDDEMSPLQSADAERLVAERKKKRGIE